MFNVKFKIKNDRNSTARSSGRSQKSTTSSILSSPQSQRSTKSITPDKGKKEKGNKNVRIITTVVDGHVRNGKWFYILNTTLNKWKIKNYEL